MKENQHSNGTAEDEYGYCPKCYGKIISRERKIDGCDICENNHVHLSKHSLKINKNDLEFIKSINRSIDVYEKDTKIGLFSKTLISLIKLYIREHNEILQIR